jgi:glutaconyl-CoA/methylmalonyl-CoA decarboxylase subunit gamma
MRLRIHVEGRAYDVEVDVLHPAPAAQGDRLPADTPIPEAVLRPRQPQRLPEDSGCRSPIAGRVVAILGSAGLEVRRHQAVVVVEAMKMENELRAGRDGTVAEVHAREGQSVDAGALLVVIQ